MKYVLTHDDREEIDFCLNHPMHSIDGYATRRERIFHSLEIASAGEFYRVLGDLAENMYEGCCDLDKRIAEEIFAEVVEGIEAGRVRVPPVFVQRNNHLEVLSSDSPQRLPLLRSPRVYDN